MRRVYKKASVLARSFLTRGRDKLFLYAILFRTPKCVGGETVDTPALGAGAARHGGSSPLPRTKTKAPIKGLLCCVGRNSA